MDSDNVNNVNDERTTPEMEIKRQRMEKLERLRSEARFDPYVIDRWDKKHKLSLSMSTSLT